MPNGLALDVAPDPSRHAAVDLPEAGRAQARWWTYLLWVAADACVGFTVAALFSGFLHWPRRYYLIPYALVGTAFCWAFFRWARIDVRKFLRRRRAAGLEGAAVVGVLTVSLVLLQPASGLLDGWRLPFDMVWSGVVYGTLDALLLTVIPVLGLWKAASALGWTRAPAGGVLVRVAAVVASMLVSAVYHLGFEQYRGPEVMGAVVGNALFTLSYVLTGSPLAPVLGHVAMHLAAVLHGPGTVNQLPPHYY